MRPKLVNFILGLALLALMFVIGFFYSSYHHRSALDEDTNACNPDAKLNWLPSKSTVVGYNVYRGDSPTDKPTLMVKLNAKPITSLYYDDCTVEKGKTYYYTVRAVTKQGIESWDSGPAIVQVPNTPTFLRSLNP